MTPPKSFNIVWWPPSVHQALWVVVNCNFFKMSGAHEQNVEKIVDFHIQRGAERGRQTEYVEERKQGDLFHLNHNWLCVCYAPRRPLFSSLWPLKGHHMPLEINNNPPKQDHRLLALTGRFNYTESNWKTIDILEYDFKNKTWFEVATMPEDYVQAHFQPHSWDYMRANSFYDKIFITRADGMTQGAIYDMSTKTWDLDWRFPIFPEGSAWFNSISPFNTILNVTPWQKYLQTCFTHGIEHD